MSLYMVAWWGVSNCLRLLPAPQLPPTQVQLLGGVEACGHALWMF